MREFDNDTLSIINAFENITGTEVRDCIMNDAIYFLVGPGKAAIAIGKGGQTIRNAENAIGKPIKVFEWAEKIEDFIRNLVPGVKKIDISGDKANVTVDSKDRGAAIGKGGSNIKILRELIERNSSIKEVKIL